MTPVTARLVVVAIEAERLASVEFPVALIVLKNEAPETLKTDVEAFPSVVCPLKIFAPVKVFDVYVFGIVEDAFT